MHLPHELTVVLTVTAEMDAVRLKIIGPPHDISLVESYFRSRIANLVTETETIVKREFVDPRPLLPKVVGEHEKN